MKKQPKETDGQQAARPVEAEPVLNTELAEVRETEKTPAKKTGNIFIGTLNVITGPMKQLTDPVKKICYEPLQLHWEERYKKKYAHHASKMLILDLVLLFTVGALAVGGIFAYFVLPVLPTAKLVELNVLAPKRIVSGEISNLIISYRNETGSELANAELKVRLPDGFVEAEALGKTGAATTQAKTDSASDGIKTIAVGSIKPHGLGEVRIRGAVFAPVGTKVTLSSELVYWEEGRSEPSRNATFTNWLVEDAVLQLAFRSPDQVVRGRQVAVTITYANQTEETIDAVVIKLTPPDDFRVTGAVPQYGDRYEWRINNLAGGAKGSITVYGFLLAGAAKQAIPNFSARGYLLLGGKQLIVQEVRANLEAQATGFSLGQELTEPASKTSLDPGEQVTVTVRYRNGGNKPIHNLKIWVEPTPQFLAETKSFTWDTSNEAKLMRIEPGESGEVIASFKIKEIIGASDVGADGRPMMEIAARAQYFMDDDLTDPIFADTAVISLPITTKLAIDASAIYYSKDGDQLGIGPLPPQVGETTKYWVFIQITNTTNTVKEALLETWLPENVGWTGRYSVTAGASMAHLPTNGRILWEIGDIPANASSAGTKVGASFEVELTPTKADAGTAPLLLKEVMLSGVDAVTQTKVRATAPAVTTAIPFGPEAARTGVVVKK
ncbi:MAG: hypothetical protein WCT10_01890 [Patescibacteria group bacterium]|jgi:hypothetical protein